MSYLSFSLPAIAAGFATPVFGLVNTALVYGAALALCALMTLALAADATRPRRRAGSLGAK